MNMDDYYVSVMKVVHTTEPIDLLQHTEIHPIQLTVDVATIYINFVVGISSREVLLFPSILLWVNLIMDTLGAMALTTKRPTYSLLNVAPIK